MIHVEAATKKWRNERE